MVEEMEDVVDTLPHVTSTLKGVLIPPVGHRYIKSLANEEGSTVHIEVELVDQFEAENIKQFKPKTSSALVKH